MLLLVIKFKLLLHFQFSRGETFPFSENIRVRKSKKDQKFDLGLLPSARMKYSTRNIEGDLRIRGIKLLSVWGSQYKKGDEKIKRRVNEFNP